MTENKFPELENEFIEYFEVTNLKPSESQLTLLLVLQKVGPLKIVCFLAGSFLFWLDWSWWWDIRQRRSPFLVLFTEDMSISYASSHMFPTLEKYGEIN